MSPLLALLLGAVQGLTEFIPVSSSAHLVLVPAFFGIKPPGAVFSVMLHWGTLLSLLAFYSRELLPLTKGLLRGLLRIMRRKSAAPFNRWQDEEARLAILILLACVPTGAIAFAFADSFEQLFEAPKPTAAFLLLTGVFLFWIAKRPANGGQSSQMSVWQALFIGTAQGLAAAPGISRSGATLTAALAVGLERKEAARFCFLVSIPVIFAAGLYESRDILALANSPSAGGPGMAELVIGTLTAALSGYLAIAVVIKAVVAGKLQYFAYYCWALGLTALVWFW